MFRRLKKYQFQLAEGHCLEACQRLVYERYLESGLITPNPEKKRVPRRPFVTLAAMEEGGVVATVTVLLGRPLPIEALFDVSHFQGRLAELTSFTTAKVGLALPMLSYCLYYTGQHNLCDVLTASFHPKYQKSYETVFGFKSLGQGVKDYPEVGGHPAEGGYLEIQHGKAPENSKMRQMPG